MAAPGPNPWHRLAAQLPAAAQLPRLDRLPVRIAGDGGQRVATAVGEFERAPAARAGEQNVPELVPDEASVGRDPEWLVAIVQIRQAEADVADAGFLVVQCDLGIDGLHGPIDEPAIYDLHRKDRAPEVFLELEAERLLDHPKNAVAMIK